MIAVMIDTRLQTVLSLNRMLSVSSVLFDYDGRT
jgi:hypothetical protein